MSDLRVDLIGEHIEILTTLREYLLSQFTEHLVAYQQPIDKGQINIQVECIKSSTGDAAELIKSLENDSSATEKIIFLISPNEFAIEDTPHLARVRLLINDASKTSKLNLQVIRGDWVGGAFGSLTKNTGYAFASILKNIRIAHDSETLTLQDLDNSSENGAEQNFRPLPKPLFNYVCEKCSDPECEHALFGFLKAK